MRKFMKYFALTVALVASLSVAGFAQSPPSAQGLQVVPIQPMSDARNQADTAPAMVIKYFAPAGGGTAMTGTTTVAFATQAITFLVNGAAYAGFECPVSGALGGIIDISNAACNTAGEIVATINSTPANFATGYFRAGLMAAQASDAITASGALVAQTATTDVSSPNGMALYWNNTVSFPEYLTMWDRNILARNQMTPKGLPKNPYDNLGTLVQYVGEKITNGGTIGQLTCYAVKPNYIQGGGCTTGGCGAYSEAVRTVYTETAGATTVLGTSLAEFPFGFYAQDEKVYCRVNSSTAASSVTELAISGFTWPTQIR